MFSSAKDEEAEVIVPAIATEDDEPSPAKKKTCCTLTMEIIKTSLIACMSLFFLIWSIIQYQEGNLQQVSIDEPGGLLIFATLCYCGATSLDVVLKAKEGGVANIVFGSLGIFAAVCWLVSGILSLNNININLNVFPALWMVGSAANISLLIFETIKLCKSKEKAGCKYVLLFIGLIFAIVANIFFIGGSAWLFYIANKDWLSIDQEEDDDIWRFRADDDYLSRHLGLNWENVHGNNGDYGDAYDVLLGHRRSLAHTIDDYVNDDLFDIIRDVSNNVKGAAGLFIGGSLMYIVHSILEVVVISMCCCN